MQGQRFQQTKTNVGGKMMEEKEIIEFLKSCTNIEWLVALNKFLSSHIEFLKIMSEIEKREG